jgi:hypothetical protein
MGDGVVDELIAFFVFLYVRRLREGEGGGVRKDEDEEPQKDCGGEEEN